MKRSSYWFAALIVLLVLPACTTTPLPDQPVQMTPALQQRLYAYDHWHITGKLGYRDNNNAGSAWLDWQQQSKSFELNLRGPFGAGATRIMGSDMQAILTRAGQEPIVATSATALTRHLFGWQWPVDQLLFWVRGIPALSSPVDSATYDSRQLLTRLQQSGWELQFTHYQTAANGLVLPGKITGKYQQMSFTLLVKKWLPAPSQDA